MQMRGWVVVAVAGLLVVSSGCKKRPKPGQAGVDNVGGVVGSDLYGEGADMLGDRFAGGEEVRGQFTAVYFDYDSSQIKDSERSKIDAVASHLQSAGTANLVVEGNADERGSNEYNLALGERRALAIRAYLVGLGIDGNRITTKSLGEEQPVVMGHDEESWSQNRRGEFVLIQ
ncbi:MAG TPA: OmpA family protein [Kiritimatiellia bacterium]|nr:OmpA family protein [Kiritimatiellia bacterium]HSA17206.1 OmpA family protein [Kiritimatiellia bacterium]